MTEPEFVQYIKEYELIIQKICSVYRHSREDREDLFQEIIFQLYKSRHQFEGRSKISTWIYRIGLNTALATFRKKVPDIIFTEKINEPHDSKESQDSQEREQQLLQMLSILSENEKAFITLYLDDISHREIAEIIGVTENNVAVKLNRIKSKIQKHFK